MRKFSCGVCGIVYDPEKGLPELGIPPGTPFEALPKEFCCPVCGAEKNAFSPLAESAGAEAEAPVHLIATLQEVIRRTPSIKSFRFAAPDRAKFKPGQYLSLSLENRAELTRYLSISSSPTEEGYLEVTKRITQSQFSQILDQVEPGYQAALTYPMGMFTFEGETEKIAMLSGGIGITPLRCMCGYITDAGLNTDVCLFYSNRNLEEVAFKSEFDAMHSANPRLKVVYTLDSAGEEWTGRRGYINPTLVREEMPDFPERSFFLCGPPRMVEAMTTMLRRELHVPEAQVRSEGFLGY